MDPGNLTSNRRKPFYKQITYWNIRTIPFNSELQLKIFKLLKTVKEFVILSFYYLLFSVI